MKSVLIVCNQSRSDTPLRRSIAHLANSCRVSVVPDGHQAFAELDATTFDIVVIDSEITGIDSLELAESIEYTDPGVPVVLMLRETQKTLWGPARQANANPILRPFKPLTFLRLIDTLLHQQVERYRDLSDRLQTVLQTLRTQTGVSDVFLIEDSGQILVSTDELENPIIRSLGYLAANQIVTKGLFTENQEETLQALNPSEKDHELYITPVLENLHLALISPVTIPPTSTEQTWEHVDTTAQEIKHTFFSSPAIDQDLSTNGTSHSNGNGNGITAQEDTSEEFHIVIPLKLGTQIVSPQENEAEEQADEVAVNWQFISNSSTVLNRLHDFCQVT